jgi:hypothetical protein
MSHFPSVISAELGDHVLVQLHRSEWFYVALRSPGASHPHSSVSVWGAIAVVITIVSGVAAVQQLGSWAGRRRLQGAQDELLRTFQLSVDTNEAKKNFEENTTRLNALRQQIEVQVPVQARRDYLKERLEQLRRDLYRDFQEYEDITRELAESTSDSAIDSQIRKVIETAIIPRRTLSDRRSIGMLVLMVTLIVISISPLRPSDLIVSYFDSLGYSSYFPLSNLFLALGLGIAMFTGLLLLALPMIPGNTRPWIFVRSLMSRKRGLLALALCMALLTVGIYSRLWGIWDGANTLFTPHGELPRITLMLTIAGSCFNLFVLTFSILLGSSLLGPLGLKIKSLRAARNIMGKYSPPEA